MVHDSELTEIQQELLEQLWQRQEEDRTLPPEFPQPEERMELESNGWVAPGSLTLTDEGRRMAALAVRRHRLAERLLTDILGGLPSRTEEDACILEHSLMHGLDERVCTFLGHPRVCPHGHPIPKGRCCRESRQSVEPVIVSLCGMNPGEEGSVSYLACHVEEDLQKFLSMGIHPGDRIQLQRKTPTFVFKVGHSSFAVDRHLACQVFVRRW
jgi:DtxR family Mn-dependent transcriptional regulator